MVGELHGLVHFLGEGGNLSISETLNHLHEVGASFVVLRDFVEVVLGSKSSPLNINSRKDRLNWPNEL